MSPEAQKLLNWIRYTKERWRSYQPIDNFSDDDAMSVFRDPKLLGPRPGTRP